MNRAECLRRLGRVDEALEVCERAVELNSNSAVLWNNFGWALQGFERYEDAIAAYTHSSELDLGYRLVIGTR